MELVCHPRKRGLNIKYAIYLILRCPLGIAQSCTFPPVSQRIVRVAVSVFPTVQSTPLNVWLASIVAQRGWELPSSTITFPHNVSLWSPNVQLNSPSFSASVRPSHHSNFRLLWRGRTRDKCHETLKHMTNFANLDEFTCSASSLVSSCAGVMSLDFKQTSVKFVLVPVASLTPDQLL